jgi:hypothetical protein
MTAERVRATAGLIAPFLTPALEIGRMRSSGADPGRTISPIGVSPKRSLMLACPMDECDRRSSLRVRWMARIVRRCVLEPSNRIDDLEMLADTVGARVDSALGLAERPSTSATWTRDDGWEVHVSAN